jgi:hypothetical protein
MVQAATAARVLTVIDMTTPSIQKQHYAVSVAGWSFSFERMQEDRWLS